MAKIYESDLEHHLLTLLSSLGYQCHQGDEFDPDCSSERLQSALLSIEQIDN